MNVINHFLLVYDRKVDKLLECVDYGSDSEAALAAYSQRGIDNWQNPDMDILLVGSDSLETVKLTHATYFANRVERAKRTSEMYDELIWTKELV